MIQWALLYRDGSFLLNASGGVWLMPTRDAARRVLATIKELGLSSSDFPRDVKVKID